jgi:hypothetical protein
VPHPWISHALCSDIKTYFVQARFLYYIIMLYNVLVFSCIRPIHVSQVRSTDWLLCHICGSLMLWFFIMISFTLAQWFYYEFCVIYTIYETLLFVILFHLSLCKRGRSTDWGCAISVGLSCTGFHMCL